ncbi:MAG: Rrf2 family transcriptional regulator [Desulfarculaceae bacterium]|nr:Rrf2 family transcriptional regulator [Desulfarculaceae bacterium]MCF8071026.1 Rrf2 family transcriptional regulator [Desulfarculaceae bacterium]MCF8100614.1 Rrf2 family transcriptional regulator [Desulfarculaceae bacterium]MCF8116952.1 Rrf2 family transcriptional regulator [Desulfarculaceae bacterium]
MQHLLKISEAASLAMHTMGLLAAEPGRLISTREMASRLRVSEAHLAKVMQRLGRAGLVRSQRGPKGGFSLIRRPEEITLLEVYEATEGPLRPQRCLLGKPMCNGNCIMGGLLERVGDQVQDYFANTRLSDFKDSFINEARNA